MKDLDDTATAVQQLEENIQRKNLNPLEEAAAIRPRIIDVVTVTPGDTTQSLAQRMAYRDFQLERFLSLNGLANNARLVPGQKVKVVIHGTRRT